MANEQLNVQALLFVVFFSAIVIAGSAVATGLAIGPSKITCQDSDGGVNAQVKGTFTNALGLKHSDYCITPDILMEMSCNELGKFEFKRISCKTEGFSKCLDGVCM